MGQQCARGTRVHVCECDLHMYVAAGPPCSCDQHKGRVMLKSLESAGLCSNVAFATYQLCDPGRLHGLSELHGGSCGGGSVEGEGAVGVCMACPHHQAWRLIIYSLNKHLLSPY